MRRQRDTPPQQRAEQQNDRTRAQKAQLLAEDGKDEVVLGLRHEQMLLAAVAQPQPRRPAGADGIQALDGLMSVPQRVGKGVEPRVEPVGGVGHQFRHQHDGRADGGSAARPCQHEPPQPGTAHEHEHRADA